MQGLMMDRPLLVSALIDYAAALHGDAQIVSRSGEGALHRYAYRDSRARIGRLANALYALGVRPGERLATLAWNGYRHFELYYGISGIGAVCHTINPRLFDDQIVYIVNHAEDRYLFVDPDLVPLLERLAGRLPRVEGYVVLTDREHLPDSPLQLLSYEQLLEGRSETNDWPSFDERSACSLCYTSGTTGNPKGVLYSHRSAVLHSYSLLTTGDRGLGPDTVMMPVVPLFHVNAWGLPYALPLVGGSFVFPGPRLDGASLFELIETEGVTDAWGVPTVWLGLLDEVRRRGARFTFTSLRSMIIGGSAAPRSLIEAFEALGVNVIHGWGMTEMSPVGSTAVLTPAMRRLPRAQQIERKIKQGRPLFGVEMKIVAEDGQPLAHDGEARGELLVRGPTVTSGYYNDPQANREAFDADGWFRTGDVASIDPEGFLAIVDRSKDVIKSGGEWISSIELENAALSHPGVAEAAVIGVSHPRWGERPLLLVRRSDAEPPVDAAGLREFLAGKVAKWWLPDAVEFVAELPHTATGKLQKTALRQCYAGYQFRTLPAKP